MKNKLLIAVLILFNSGLASAESLKPLTSFITDAKPDVARVSYIMARCSALYMNIQIIADKSNPELAKKYELASKDALYKFVSYSEMASKEKNPNYKSPDNLTTKAVETVNTISKTYKPILEASHAATGSYLSNRIIQGDLEVCQQLLSNK